MIIQSLIDTDLYKLTMGQAVFNNYPRVEVEYQLVNRGKTKFPTGFAGKLQEEIRQMSGLVLSKEEKDFLNRRCGHYLKPTYLDWLSSYRFNPDEVAITQKEGDLGITITGPWYRTIYWEVPLMATISELYFQITGQQPQPEWVERTKEKGATLRMAGAYLSDFGTRRRFSLEVHEKAIEALIAVAGRASEGGILRGTSNVRLAAKYNLAPIGTFAHEWVMVHSALYGYKMATTKALETWAREFNGQLGIALMDTYGTDVFLKSFDAFYARLFEGVRQDSGNPLEILEKAIAHYQKLFIDPTTKTFVASDSLDVGKALEIQNRAKGRIRCLFGIGTNLTNDVGVKPLNIVIKLFRVFLPDGISIPVIKLSDDPGKITGDQEAIKAAFSELGIEP
jgi:nicotinate phosphoribosyltransferase